MASAAAASPKAGPSLDECGREITASRIITVEPAPEAAFEPADDITITCEEAATLTGSELAYSNGEAGACLIAGTVTGTLDGSYGECGGSFTESWSFTDACGRTITASRIITVEPAPEAAFEPADDITITCEEAATLAGSELAYSNGEAGACLIAGTVTGTLDGSYDECGGSFTGELELYRCVRTDDHSVEDHHRRTRPC
jgi:hypothetical protein